jgi:hypothetical protein
VDHHHYLKKNTNYFFKDNWEIFLLPSSISLDFIGIVNRREVSSEPDILPLSSSIFYLKAK